MKLGKSVEQTKFNYLERLGADFAERVTSITGNDVGN